MPSIIACAKGDDVRRVFEPR